MFFQNTKVIDFVFIEDPRDDFNFKNIVLIVKQENLHYLQIVSLLTREISYTLNVEAGTQVIADTEASQRVMLLAEPAKYAHFCLDLQLIYSHCVALREISESEPEKKLTRLIEQNRLDEAEKFALEFGLDCQRVHISRMDSYFEAALADISPDVFTNFIRSMDKVIDANRVCF